MVQGGVDISALLLLDEPASALDPSSTQNIEELLYELKQELTIIIEYSPSMNIM